MRRHLLKALTSQLAARMRWPPRAYDQIATGLGDYGTSDRAAPPA